MNSLIRSLVVAVALFISGAALADAQLGKDYSLLNPAQPTGTKKIEVLEFFFYGCSHCFHLHPLLSAWEKTMPKDVELTFVPTIFRDSWEPMANTCLLYTSGIGESPYGHRHRKYSPHDLGINCQWCKFA